MNSPQPTPAQLRHIVEAAGLAPSVHNTQPWRFVCRFDRLELHAEPTRQLRVIDPDAHQLHLSCGAALAHAKIAARALDIDARIRLLPDPDEPAHLADLVLTGGTPASPAELRLAEAMRARHTHRGAFEDRPVPAALLDRLRSAAAMAGGWLHQVADPERLLELEVLLSHADAREERDSDYRAELRKWVHDGTRPRADGIPPAAVGMVKGSSLRQRDFVLSSPSRSDGSCPHADRPVVVVLSSREDSPREWLRAGQALGQVLLRAAEEGLQAQPLGQVTDVLAYRLGLRQVLGIVALPQLVLRVGFAHPVATTPRRSVEDVLHSVSQ